MPHGTGHHHHHHHHHHHGGYRHHHHHTQIGYYGGGPTWYYYRHRPVTWISASIVFTILIIVSAVVTVRYTAIPDYTTDDGLHYAPTDTRIIPVSNAFCQNLELTVDDSLIGYMASLSMVDSRPRLTGNETFSLEETPYFNIDDYSYYYYYLYPGSNFSLSACISDGTGTATFSLIKGHKNFKRWIDNYHIAPTKDSFVISALCDAQKNNMRTYHVQDEDYYYLVYNGSYYMQLHVNMTFNRTLYEVADNSSSGDWCSVYMYGSYGDTCAVSVPLSGKTAFLTVAPQAGTEIDWTGEIGLSTKCVPRVWMYVVITLSALVGLLAILVPVLACIIIKLRKRNKATPTVSAAVESDNSPLLTPPTDPYLQQPIYGSNYTSPPVYKP